MAIIAEEFEFVVGVDTHARTHAFANASGFHISPGNSPRLGIGTGCRA